ncbi:FAD-dependent oxidoreductase [bacterium AH-315-I18]|nr:FAD-dependent oxidoreductase [bacterium AH-315-I18]
MARKIVIVGGVAGGASAAARARRCNENAQILMIEKDEHVSFANCGLPYYIGGEITDRKKLLVATPQKFETWFNVRVWTKHLVTAIDRQNKTLTVLDRKADESKVVAYDKLILAPGASPIVPPIDGIRSSNVFTLRNVDDTDRIKSYVDQDRRAKAVVIGAGFIGLEMVEMLHHIGMDVSLVELAPQVLPPLDPEMAHMIEEELEKKQVKLHLGNGLKGFITDGDLATGVVLNDDTKLAADLVILAIGVRPSTDLAQAADLEMGKTGGIAINEYTQTSDPDIYAVGDAVEYTNGVTDLLQRIPLAGPANRAGRVAGEHAATDQSPALPSVLGTAIVRVFDKVAAVTGCNQRCIDAMGYQTRHVIIPANSHASYYPGAQEMVIKLVYQPSDGKVLGAQIVGGEGVDKRIDVIATAIAFGGSIDDLAGLDLAYAPPFGSAKDPVHLAAFAAQNDLREMESFIADPPAGDQVVDVRSDSEWQAGHLSNATHMPLHEIRERIKELDPTLPTTVVCRGGQRAYYASRILRQHGFKQIKTLAGGMMMRPHQEKKIQIKESAK